MNKLKYPTILTCSIRDYKNRLISKAQTIDDNEAPVIFENGQWNLFNKIHVSSVLLYPEISPQVLKKYRKEYHKKQKSIRAIKENKQLQKIQRRLFSKNYKQTKEDINKRKITKQKRIEELQLLRSGKT